MPATDDPWDVVIAGAGPAGLSAALVLGRCRRRVLLCDAGTPRNHATGAMHGYLGHDGIPPPAFRELAHEELARYETVRFLRERVEDAEAISPDRFRVVLSGGETAVARKLLLATGVVDEVPDIPGFAELWGSTVHSCPYCDGWELRDAPLAAYGRRRRGLEIARALTAWSRDLVLCTDGPSGLSREERADLAANGIEVVETRVERLEGRDRRLEAVVFADGRRLPRRALFFDTPSWPQSTLAARLGCAPNARGGVRAGRLESTTVPGVYVAGNILRDVQLAIVAAAEGCKAAFGINRSLTREEFVRRGRGVSPVEHPPVSEPESPAPEADATPRAIVPAELPTVSVPERLPAPQARPAGDEGVVLVPPEPADGTDAPPPDDPPIRS
ncbi:MAG TPA: NAD(P)/FAD-dependent oxidoreductase [Burkholderiaceae bacterium]|nr:NAD(P)/FAD-dependent oxidoreductase [Burkholderiaceae bacterium]